MSGFPNVSLCLASGCLSWLLSVHLSPSQASDVRRALVPLHSQAIYFRAMYLALSPIRCFSSLGFVSHQCPISSILSDVLAWPRLFSTCLPICLSTRLPWTDRFPPVSHFSSCLICLSPHLRRPWAEGFPLFSHWLSHLFSYLSPYFLAFLRLKGSHLCPTSLIICILICGGPGCGSLC